MSDKGDDNKAPDVKEAAAEASAGSKVGSMKSGEYLLHVLIETGKMMGVDGEDTVDPLVKVSILGKNKETTHK